jgi:hypothetical protein
MDQYRFSQDLVSKLLEYKIPFKVYYEQSKPIISIKNNRSFYTNNDVNAIELLINGYITDYEEDDEYENNWYIEQHPQHDNGNFFRNALYNRCDINTIQAVHHLVYKNDPQLWTSNEFRRILNYVCDNIVSIVRIMEWLLTIVPDGFNPTVFNFLTRIIRRTGDKVPHEEDSIVMKMYLETFPEVKENVKLYYIEWRYLLEVKYQLLDYLVRSRLIMVDSEILEYRKFFSDRSKKVIRKCIKEGFIINAPELEEFVKG